MTNKFDSSLIYKLSIVCSFGCAGLLGIIVANFTGGKPDWWIVAKLSCVCTIIAFLAIFVLRAVAVAGSWHLLGMIERYADVGAITEAQALLENRYADMHPKVVGTDDFRRIYLKIFANSDVGHEAINDQRVDLSTKHYSSNRLLLSILIIIIIMITVRLIFLCFS